MDAIVYHGVTYNKRDLNTDTEFQYSTCTKTFDEKFKQGCLIKSKGTIHRIACQEFPTRKVPLSFAAMSQIAVDQAQFLLKNPNMLQHIGSATMNLFRTQHALYVRTVSRSGIKVNIITVLLSEVGDFWGWRRRLDELRYLRDFLKKQHRNRIPTIIIGKLDEEKKNNRLSEDMHDLMFPMTVVRRIRYQEKKSMSHFCFTVGTGIKFKSVRDCSQTNGHFTYICLALAEKPTHKSINSTKPMCVSSNSSPKNSVSSHACDMRTGIYDDSNLHSAYNYIPVLNCYDDASIQRIMFKPPNNEIDAWKFEINDTGNALSLFKGVATACDATEWSTVQEWCV